MELTDEEEQFVKGEFRKKELKKQIKDVEDIMWGKVNTLKKGSDKLRWEKIQDEKSKCREDIKPLQEELQSL